MNKRYLFALWGGMFILCAGLGFIPEPEGAQRAVLTAASLLFFLPPALLLRQAGKEDRAVVRQVRNLSALSLAVTAGLIAGNFLTPLMSEFWGSVLYGLLVIASSPMICCGNWALSLFLWACLLMTGQKILRTK